MRTTLNLDDDVLLAARHVAARERVSLGEAVCRLVRRGVQGSAEPPPGGLVQAPLRGRFALLPARDEVVTPQHVRELMEREGI